MFATIDHVVDTRPGRNSIAPGKSLNPFIEVTRREAHAAGIRLFDVSDDRQGIVHVISPELGIVLPGLTLVCPDSHTGTQGAFGALAWGIGSTEAEHALATQTLCVAKPATLRVWVDGSLQQGVTAKDLALHLIGARGSAGGQGFVSRVRGSRGPRARSRGATHTLQHGDGALGVHGNHRPGRASLQLSARTRLRPGRRAVHARDGTMAGVVQRLGRSVRSRDAGECERSAAHGHLGNEPARCRADRWRCRARVRRRVGPDELALPTSARSRTWGSSRAAPGGVADPGRIHRLVHQQPAQRPAPCSCDPPGEQIAPGVRAICVPGSTRSNGSRRPKDCVRIFESAGFEWRESGCSLCFFAGGESFAPGQRVVSSTNRNFEGRQGPQTRTHLASPETVAASAIAGHIADPRHGLD